MTTFSSDRLPHTSRWWAMALAVVVPLASALILVTALGLGRPPIARAAGENVQFNAAAFSVNEADGSAVITVTISPAPTDPLTVSLVSMDGSASSLSDYAAVNSTVTVNPGITELTFTVDITNDALYEGSETLTLSLTEVISGSIGTPGAATLTITDNEVQPSVALSAANYTVNEVGGSAAITATLSGASAFTITVNAATSDNTANSLTDYTAVNTTLTFVPGAALAAFSVPITNDTLYEGGEALTVTLSAPTNSTLGAPSAAALTIVDNETQPTVQLSAGSYSLSEGAGSQTITATLSGASAFPASVTISSTDGTASGAGDYTPINRALSFAPGATLTTTTVAITDDALYENTETFSVTLSGPSGATLGSPSSASVQINSNDALPVLQLTAITQTVSEGVGTVTVTATLNTLSGLAASAPFGVGGTATGADHNLANGVVSIPAGSLSDSATFTVTDDALNEDNETVVVTLGAPTNATLGATAAQTITLQDNDPLPELSINDVAVAEGDSGPVSAVFTVNLSAASGRAVSVNYASANGTAAGSDFAAASGALNFPAGATSRQITVTVNGDTTFEGNETFLLNLSGAANASLADGVGLGTINNDDAAPTLAINDVTVTEADTNTSAVFTVTLTGATEVTATVNFAAAGNTATLGADFSLASGALSFPPGDTTETLTVTVLGEDVYELNETFTVTLSAPTGASLADGVGLGTINNDDAAPTLAINDVTVTEADTNTSAVFTVTLTGATEVTATVNFAAAGNTATLGADFSLVSGALSFPPGDTTETLTVTIIGEDVYELNEAYTVTLSAPTGASLADGVGLGTINNDDAAPTLAINDVTVTEGNAGTSTAAFTVTLSGATALPASVAYATANGTATAGSDYVAASGTLTFTPGAATQLISVTVNGDALDENDETFTVNLSSPTSATLTDDQASGAITDDDPLPALSIGNATVTETDAGAVSAIFTVTLSPVSGRAVTVNYATANLTATTPADYAPASGTLTFTAGATTQTITVTVQGDTLDEDDETFAVNLSSPGNATIADGAGLGTITDNDPLPSLSIAPSVIVNETDAGTVNAVFNVTLSTASGRAVTVNYATSDNTAASPADFIASSGALTFTPGVTVQAITVTVQSDLLDEIDETFLVTLGTPVNASIASGFSIGTILDNDPTPSLSINNATVTEGNAGSVNAVFTVTVSAASGRAVSVNYATANLTATTPADYVGVSGALAFTPGDVTETVTVTVNGDALDEDDETFAVNLSGPGNATIADGAGLGTITDDDPTPSLAINNVTVAEGNAGSVNAVFTVTLSASSGRAVTVNYATANLTATTPADYVGVSGTLTFTPGVTVQALTVAVQGDALDEVDETFAANLSSPGNATIADGAGLGTITDDDPTPSLAINNATVAEGNAGSVNVVFTVTLSAASGRAVTVNYATANLTATTPADFIASSGTLTFTPGVTVQAITVAVQGDLLDEVDETFAVNLSGPGNATIADGAGLGTINDDDPTPSLAINNATVTEGNAGSVNAVFTVTLSAASGRAVTVNYATSDNTATSPADYAPASGTLIFNPGATTQAITVTVNGDVPYELNETYTVTLSGETNATLADASGVGTITNDDAAPTLTITDVTVTEADTNTSAVFTVTLTGPTQLTATVNFATAGNTATSGLDFTAASGALSFPPGDTTETLTVTVLGEDVYELNETFTVTLSTPANAQFGDAVGLGTINNDDALPTLALSDVTVTEGNAGTSTAAFTVTLSGATALPATVAFATANGTATAGSDYVAASGTLTFTPGVTTQLISVTVNGDMLDEDNETFTLNLSSPTSATLTDGAGLGTITDDDPTPSLAINNTTVTEGNSGSVNTVFTVTLSAASARSITANYATANLTATSPVDYVGVSGTLTFTPGITTQTIIVSVNGDTVDEDNETFAVNLSSPVNATLADGSGLGTITDDDATPSLSINDAAVVEGNSGTINTVFTITLSALSGRDVAVLFATADLTAASPADYASVSGVLTFTSGVTTQTVIVTVNGDTLDEDDETFSLALSAPVNATLGDGTGVGAILDDDAMPSIAITDQSLTEGNSGASVMQFTANLSAPSGRNVTLNYATVNLTATAGADYNAISGTVAFAPGSTSEAITVTIQGDALDEVNETFALNLSNVLNALLPDPQAIGTLLDDDPTPTLSIASASVTETNTSAALVFTVTLSAPSGQSVAVSYATADGTAGAPADYVTASGTLTFTPGLTTRTLTVTVQGDAFDEVNETLVMNLSNPVNAGLLASQGTGTILDDDATPTLQFSTAAQTISEGVSGGAASVTVTLSSASGFTVTVPYTVSGSATGADHTLVNGQITVNPLALSSILTFTIINDALDESNETVILSLGTPVNAGAGAPAVHTLTISDNDSPPAVRFSSGAFATAEDGGPAAITATLTAPSGLTVTAAYTTSNGSATAGSDYAATTGVITFTPGLTLTTFTVPITADTTYENGETFSVTLGSPTNATLGSPATATITITNDDGLPTVQFESAQFSVSEDSGGASPLPSTALISVTLSNPSVFTITVNYTTTAGTATSGVDYVETSGTLTFAPGQTTRTFSVTTVVDQSDELLAEESVLLALGNPISNATLGALSSAALNIVDNDGTPTVRFGSATVNVNEGVAGGAANLSVSLSNPSDITVTVDVRSANGTATAGLDYTVVSETITFTPGDTSAIVTVPITDDNIHENNETFSVALSNPAPPGALVLAPSITTTQVTIVNNDSQPTIQFSAAAFSGSELANAAVMTMTLSRPSALNTRVTYATSDGTALAASDYAAQSAQLTFSPGVTSLTVTLPISNDLIYEGAETFNVTLSGPINGSLGSPSSAVITISDNDSPPTIQFSAPAYSRIESGGTVVLTATLTGTTAVTASVSYAASNGTAVAPGDYTAQSGTLTFLPGDAAETITITLANGAVYEGDESFTVTLNTPVSATLGAPSAATVVIIENDAAPTLRLSAASDSVQEGATITVSVVLSGSTAVTATVGYATASGTALAGSDYAGRSGTLSFAPGTTLRTFTVPITDDVTYETNETFGVALSAPVSATLASPTTATYTILNNDNPPVIQLSAPSFVVGEGIGSAAITATLAPISAVTATVNYATSNLTATAGSDYVPVTGTLTFTPGLTLTSFSIPITDDVLLEGNEWLNVSLSAPGAATLGITATATLNIANNDPQAGCVIYNSANIPLAIPDNNPLGITSTLTIPNPGQVITDVSVRIENIQHTWVGDLQITIVSPGGQSVRLFRGIGAGGDHLLFTVFNDAGAGFLGANAPFTGKFRPEGTGAGQLSTFDNQISPGIWKLNVADLASQDTGTLNAWSLEICGPARAPYQVFLPLIRR